MGTKKIIWEAGFRNIYLSQAISSGVEFCMVSDDDHQASPFMYCKDYIQDAYQGKVLKKARNIYGFSYDPESPQQPSNHVFKLCVTNSSDPEMAQKIPNLMDFIHQIESHLKIEPKTTVQQCEDVVGKYVKCGIWYIEGSKRWMNSPPMISLYTLFIRIGFGHTIGQEFQKTLDDIIANKKLAYQRQDCSRLCNAKTGIDKILKYGDQKIFYKDMKKNFPDVDTSTMHNNMGICGFTGEYTKKIVPYWHRTLTRKATSKKLTVSV